MERNKIQGKRMERRSVQGESAILRHCNEEKYV